MGKDESGVVGVVEAVGVGESAVGGRCGKVVVACHHVVHLVAHQTRHHLMAGSLQASKVSSVANTTTKMGLLDEEVVAVVAHHWPGVGGRTGGMQHIGGGATSNWEPSATLTLWDTGPHQPALTLSRTCMGSVSISTRVDHLTG